MAPEIAVGMAAQGRHTRALGGVRRPMVDADNGGSMMNLMHVGCRTWGSAPAQHCRRPVLRVDVAPATQTMWLTRPPSASGHCREKLPDWSAATRVTPVAPQSSLRDLARLWREDPRRRSWSVRRAA
jgi:hypothetical protein